MGDAKGLAHAADEVSANVDDVCRNLDYYGDQIVERLKKVLDELYAISSDMYRIETEKG